LIYTVTFNPALDYLVSVDTFNWGVTNRTSRECLSFGGKGINVTTVLDNLGFPSKALGFVAGFTGEALERGLAQKGLKTDFIHLPEGDTRINVKLRGRLATLGSEMPETEINGRGPDISEQAFSQLLDQLDGLQEGDILVVSGNIPPSLPDNAYAFILARQQKKGTHVVVDAARDLLMNTLPLHPFLIKPNDQEVAQLFDCDVASTEELFEVATKLQDIGASNVLISRGHRGSLLLDALGNRHEAGVPEGQLVSSVGAGDSMVAGFIVGYLQALGRQLDDAAIYSWAFRMANVCASATAYSDGLATQAAVDALLDREGGISTKEDR